MDISSPSPLEQLGRQVQLAMQGQVLSQARVQGANLVALISSAPSPAGSVNLPTQGQHVDFRA